MRQTSTLHVDSYHVIIPKMLYEQFLVAAGYVVKLVSPAFAGASVDMSKVMDADVGAMVSKMMVAIDPQELPTIFRAMMVGVTVMGPDPLEGGKMCAELSRESLNEVFGENPMLPIKILEEVVKLNVGFLKTVFPKWKEALSTFAPSGSTSENSTSSAGPLSEASTRP